MAAAWGLGVFDEEPMHYTRVNVTDLTDRRIHQLTRLNRELFNYVFELVRPALERPTNRSEAIPADTQLLTALGFYASGGFQWAVGPLGQMSQPSACRVLHAVTDALCDLAQQFIKFPFTPEEQARVKQGFYEIANFPNVLGSIDGTNVNMKRPSQEHSEQFLNQHQRFSMNVMAVCDADLKFLNVLADYPGSNGDGHVWANSELLRLFENGTIVNGWLLGDYAYPLQPWLMTPLANPNTPAEEGYNRSHKRTQSTIERAFGLLKSRFRCLDDSGGILAYSPQKICRIVIACCVLHNMCIDARLEVDLDPGVADWHEAQQANHEPAAPAAGTAVAVAIQRRLINTNPWPGQPEV